MHIEQLDDDSRIRIHERHQAMTQAALVQVFGMTQDDAARAVRELWSRYDAAPRAERDLLLHNDPVALACDLAGQDWSSIPQWRLDKFNESRRAALEELARAVVP
ncbi:hypothetical protein LQG66_28000 [Bradyrhizobium ontarionense]|uniref:Uncharacterized protein n=1 Tax=Bradyrhizobium ontarionense TaxID=2898149 RepID=A0ABY3R816_9BRAD|nr:hypothetical protein [Bradyrhizobium sp. A19]UFZ03060.1 hypothetical protein LQG66_28000 [Bradyrhizobium sp. A19]